MLERLDEPADAAITTSAGYPLDLTYYQAIKGVTAASHIVKPGGAILLAAACSEGAGAPEFRRMIADGVTDAEFLDRIAGAPVDVDQWQLEKLALVTTKQRLHWYVPGLPAEYHAKIWGKSHQSIEAAVAALAAELPAGAKVAVIPEGPYVLAKSHAHETVMA
jgi:nickel-dependent lactate racemase